MNKIHIKGIVAEVITDKNGVYKSKVIVMRDSGICDCVPIVASGNVGLDQGDVVDILGEIVNDGVSICVNAKAINQAEFGFANEVEIEGCVCSRIRHLLSPKGTMISDTIIKSGDKYIPCVIEGRKMANIGSMVRVCGRFQSREYNKGDEIKTEYEIAVKNCEKLL